MVKSGFSAQLASKKGNVAAVMRYLSYFILSKQQNWVWNAREHTHTQRQLIFVWEIRPIGCWVWAMVRWKILSSLEPSSRNNNRNRWLSCFRSHHQSKWKMWVCERVKICVFQIVTLVLKRTAYIRLLKANHFSYSFWYIRSIYQHKCWRIQM